MTAFRAVFVLVAGLLATLPGGGAHAELAAVLPVQAPPQQSTPPANQPETQTTPQQSQQPTATPPSRCQPQRPVSALPVPPTLG